MPTSRTGSATPRVTKRRVETRNRLLEAAGQVFAERGFGRATVEDVCERAGYSRGAFYSNFASLDELFFALYTSQSSALVAAVAQAVAVTPPGVTLEQVVDRVVATLPISRESHLLNLEFAAYALRHSEIATSFAAHRRALRDSIAPILELGLLAGGLAVTAGRLDQIARAVAAVQDGMFLQELLEPGNADLPTLRRKILVEVITAGG